MSPHVITSLLQRQKLPALQIMLLVLFLVVCGVGIVSSTAQSPKQDEREIEDKIPKHLPIKVKLKNLEKVKDLKNEHWARDVEIEVQNTGNKPIYYLRLTLYFVDIKPESADLYGWPLKYGRRELVDINNRATSEDVPIQPGETYVFKVPTGMITGWEGYRADHNLPHPKKIGLQFEVLSYGDGTGFNTTGGLPVPHQQSSNRPCGNQRDDGTILKAKQNFLPDRPPNTQFQSLHLLPANFLPVNFF